MFSPFAYIKKERESRRGFEFRRAPAAEQNSANDTGAGGSLEPETES